MYDVCNIQSFINLRDWLQKIREFSDNDVVIGLVANKSDLVDEDDRKNCYGKYARRNGDGARNLNAEGMARPATANERRPSGVSNQKPEVHSKGRPYDRRLLPDEQDQMGQKQAQAMRRCFSDPDMNQDRDVPQPPTASTPGQGQGGKTKQA